uniref:Uncharacterized protein n=1 Tax=Oryza nivara TaxID=4536 RepID=A0A0E0FRK4_ORYNI
MAVTRPGTGTAAARLGTGKAAVWTGTAALRMGTGMGTAATRLGTGTAVAPTWLGQVGCSPTPMQMAPLSRAAFPNPRRCRPCPQPRRHHPPHCRPPSPSSSTTSSLSASPASSMPPSHSSPPLHHAHSLSRAHGELRPSLLALSPKSRPRRAPPLPPRPLRRAHGEPTDVGMVVVTRMRSQRLPTRSYAPSSPPLLHSTAGDRMRIDPFSPFPCKVNKMTRGKYVRAR